MTSELRSAQMAFRFTSSELAAFKKAAAQTSLGVSAHARMTIREQTRYRKGYL